MAAVTGCTTVVHLVNTTGDPELKNVRCSREFTQEGTECAIVGCTAPFGARAHVLLLGPQPMLGIIPTCSRHNNARHIAKHGNMMEVDPGSYFEPFPRGCRGQVPAQFVRYTGW